MSKQPHLIDAPEAPKGLVAEYIDLWRSATGEVDPAWSVPRLGNFLKQRARADGEGEVRRRMYAFFDSKEPFIVSNAYSPSVFQNKYNTLTKNTGLPAPSSGLAELNRNMHKLKAIAAMEEPAHTMARSGLGIQERKLVDEMRRAK